MKKFALSSLALALSLFVQSSSANVVGYINYTFTPGFNYFGDFFLQSPNNLANNVLNAGSMFPDAPVGTALTKWDPIGNHYLPYSIFNGTTWSINYDLSPGQGAVLFTTSIFTNTFVGEVQIPRPTPPNRPPGLYLISPSGSPTNNLGDPAFLGSFQEIIGRPPAPGESVSQFNPLTQTFSTKSFDGGVWMDENFDPVAPPTLFYAESAFFGLGNAGGVLPPLPPPVVPEPTAAALLFVGGLVGKFISSRRRSA